MERYIYKMFSNSHFMGCVEMDASDAKTLRMLTYTEDYARVTEKLVLIPIKRVKAQ